MKNRYLYEFLMFSSPRPIVHLSIDLQKRYLKKLSPERASYLLKHVESTAKALRSFGIPTIWVAYRDLFETPDESIGHFFSVKAQVNGFPVKSFEPVLEKSLGLPELQEGDLAYVKAHDSVFEGVSSIDHVLKKVECKNLLVSGMNTHACVADTISDAMMYDYHVYPLVDCLADKGKNKREEYSGDPEWHICALSHWVRMPEDATASWYPLKSQKLLAALAEGEGSLVEKLKKAECEKIPEEDRCKRPCGHSKFWFVSDLVKYLSK